MQLFVEDVARLLNVSEETVYGWVNQGEIPFHRVNRQYRFARAEILEWATSRRLHFLPAMVTVSRSSTPLPTVRAALEAGRIVYGLQAQNRESFLQAIAGSLPVPEGFDREFLLQMLRTQDEFVAAGDQDGTVIQHVRNPIVLSVPAPALSLYFLTSALFLDGMPVRAAFVLVSDTIRVHFHLLSRLAMVTRHPAVRSALANTATPEEILAAVELGESELARERSSPSQPSPPAPEGMVVATP